MKVFRHHQNGTIEILSGSESITLSLDQFRKYEPGYSLPLNAVSQYYEPGFYRCIKATNGNGYPLSPNWADGDRFIDRIQDFIALQAYEIHETLESLKDSTAIKRKIDPVLARKSEYPAITDLVIALWERIIESDSTKSDELQKQRESVKKKYPKTKRKSK